MENQNVTVSLPADVVREARHLAVDQGMSLSKLVGSLLQEKIAVSRAESNRQGEREQLLNAALQMGREAGDHGTNGATTRLRDDLHER